jgi:hypothetical protein
MHLFLEEQSHEILESKAQHSREEKEVFRVMVHRDPRITAIFAFGNQRVLEKQKTKTKKP